MTPHATLNGLAAGERGTILALRASGGERRRLLELGFVPGAEVAAVGRAPFGGPAAFAVCGAVIALRSDDAAKIILLS